MSGVKINGKVKWFNNAKGYGFINEEGKTEDLFAHYSAIIMEGYRTLKAGQLVTFEIIQGPKGLHATNIDAVKVDIHAKTAASHAHHVEKKQTA
ncbi:cold shock domain-containing protein CspD [Pseudomonas sp. P115]|uniref:cold shock domain-containing protein CspD n=1 Tax=Pseudomonas pisciculturae TaxID=2730413 RepID=UPI00135A3999|nr:cold shock domain-containing protein CspD [Pseudomonas pisciculturae]MBF6030353.1 cold shock domain-containing protein CspD [Pseudomonas pisciculturae]